jgi:multiple sugar transport system substrate-binding protein
MKQHRVLALLLLAGLVAAACGTSPTPLAPEPTQAVEAPAQPVATEVEPTAVEEPVTLVFWSHWATEPSKQQVLMAAADILRERHPNVTVDFTWWNKVEMFPAMRNAFTAGEGFPDIFYWDRLGLEFIPAGWLVDLGPVLDWSEVQDWARESWIRPGPDGKDGTWAVPIETQTDEIYYNKDIFDKLGVTVPDDYTFTAEEFYDICVKARAAGYDCFSNGVADYPNMGAYLFNFMLLRQLGPTDLVRLFAGDLSWNDPDVVAAMEYVKRVIDVPAFALSLSTMNIAEMHTYFHTQQKAAMFLVGSWYTGRAFVPPADGGQPADFRLGMLRYPTMPNGRGDGYRLSGVAGAISVAEKSPNRDLAIELAQIIASTEIGNLWVETTAGSTGMITTTTGGPYVDYFAEYAKVHEGEINTPFVSAMISPPAYNDAYLSVVCQALNLRQITLDEALAKMEEARLAIAK